MEYFFVLCVAGAVFTDAAVYCIRHFCCCYSLVLLAAPRFLPHLFSPPCSFVPFSESLCAGSNAADPSSGHPKAIFDAAKSFPSGHAQFSAFVFFSVAVAYIKRKRPRWLGLMVQLGFLSYWLGASLTRYTDNRHHPEDIAAGAALGAATAAAMVRA